MRCVVDANVFAGYFRVAIGADLGDMTADPGALFDADPEMCRFVFDQGGQIQHEWENVADSEFCRAWLGDALISGKATLVIAASDASLTTLLKGHGFPLGGRDIWYLRTLASAPKEDGVKGLASEDMDFFQPNKKCSISAGDRLEFLLGGKGALRKDLLKKGLDVRCVAVWVESMGA